MSGHSFIFSIQLWSATESISVMRMLAGQAESNISFSVNAADEPGAIIEGEFEEDVYDQFGQSYPCQRTYYTCGSSVGYDCEEVKSEYKFLITQLTRRSAFLTIFGLFEHRMSKCLDFLVSLTEFEGEIKGKGPVEKAHTIVKRALGGKDVTSVDHLTVIRNIMIHNDGVAADYNKLIIQDFKKSPSEKRLVSAIRRSQGVSVNGLDGVLMDSSFLSNTVDEFDRYIRRMEALVQAFKR